VGHAVGVGVSLESVFGVEAHAAEYERAARDEAVDVITVADAVRHSVRRQA
jgi:hypothetical protein